MTTDGDTGDSFNRYGYANNNPYRYIDKDGRVPETPSVVTVLPPFPMPLPMLPPVIITGPRPTSLYISLGIGSVA